MRRLTVAAWTVRCTLCDTITVRYRMLTSWCLQEASQPGKLSGLWSAAVQSSGLEQADVSGALSELLASKDAADVQKAKKAAFLAASVMQKHAVPRLESERSACPAALGWFPQERSQHAHHPHEHFGMQRSW